MPLMIKLLYQHGLKQSRACRWINERSFEEKIEKSDVYDARMTVEECDKEIVYILYSINANQLSVEIKKQVFGLHLQDQSLVGIFSPVYAVESGQLTLRYSAYILKDVSENTELYDKVYEHACIYLENLSNVMEKHI